MSLFRISERQAKMSLFYSVKKCSYNSVRTTLSFKTINFPISIQKKFWKKVESSVCLMRNVFFKFILRAPSVQGKETGRFLILLIYFVISDNPTNGLI